MHKMLIAGLATTLLASLPADAWAIPAWARKYNANCSMCHAPAVPRLNTTGLKFKWAGYRSPEEIGENAQVKNIAEYLGARGRMRYSISETEKSSPSKSQFELSDLSIFIGGAIGKHFGVFSEAEFEGGAASPSVKLSGVWGDEGSFAGFRIGLSAWLIQGAVAGWDRPTGLARPTPMNGKLTTALPFTFARNQPHLEGFWVKGQNRLSVELLNGVTPTGSSGGADDLAKDYAVIDQFIYDDNGSGIGAMVYFGGIMGADPKAPTVKATFTRYALTANKIFKHAELQGGYALGEDSDLPVVTGGAFKKTSVSASGYWVYGGYTIPKNNLTVFSRYELVNPDKDTADSETSRIVLGSVLPVNLPEFLRFAVEYTLDSPKKAGSLKKHGFTIEMMLNF